MVDAHGRFMTQRELPRLATVQAQLRGDTLHLSAPAQPLLPVNAAINGSSRRVRIWQDECAADDCGDAAAQWLTTCLGQPLRLVRFDQRAQRPSSRQWTGEFSAVNQFSDGFPLLVANSASLADLNARMQHALPMERFRPNLVLDGLAAWEEDHILELRRGAVRLRLVKPCTRCIITTTDQLSGVRDTDEPLRTLRGFRYDQELRGVCFAWNAIIIAGVGATLAVGEQFEIVERPRASGGS